MHPIVAPAMGLLPRHKRSEKQTKSSKASALHFHHARALVDHIKRLFQSGDFVGERVEASWNVFITVVVLVVFIYKLLALGYKL